MSPFHILKDITIEKDSTTPSIICYDIQHLVQHTVFSSDKVELQSFNIFSNNSSDCKTVPEDT